MGLSGLTPVGLTFSIIILLAMTAGICTIIWYTIIVPLRRKRMLHRPQSPLIDEEKTVVNSSKRSSKQLDAPGILSPDLDHEAVTPKDHQSPFLSSPGSPRGLKHTPLPLPGTIFSTLNPEDLVNFKPEDTLTRPPPILSIQKKIRFSDPNHDGREAPWWCY